MSRTLATLIIINYNGERYLHELFSSLRTQSLQSFSTLFIDNDSSDSSISTARALYPEAEVIPLEQNMGFAAAGNLGVQRSTTPFIAFLNTDLRLEACWLEELVQILESTQAAAAAPKMLLHKDRGKLNGVGGAMNYLGYTWDRGMFEPDCGQFDQVEEVLFAPAAASLFRRERFEEVRGFDERFFMYHEDVDLGWRMRLFGFRILTAPKAIVLHHFGGSTQAEKGLAWRETLGERNAICSLIKNYERNSLSAALKDHLLLRQKLPRKLAQLRNFTWNLKELPETLAHRRFIQRNRVICDRELRSLIVQSKDVPIRL